MSAVQVFSYAFNTGAGGQTITQNFDPLDLSRADTLRAYLTCTVAAEDAGDTLNVYIQSRGPNGVWTDRIAFTQLLGNLSPSANAPEVIEAVLQKFDSLSDDEEESEPYGSAGASHLTAGTVRNGPFPGRYRNAGVGTETAWRAVFVVVDADNDGDFEGTLIVEADFAD